MKEILLIVPSYQRQNKIEACIRAWRDTTSGHSDFLLVLEEDDPYPEFNDVVVMKGTYGSVGAAMNAAVKKYPDYKIYGHINDDHHLKTKGWEDRVIQVLSGGGYTYGNDLLQGERLATQVFISGDIVRKLGYMGLPALDHLYIDDYWMVMGRAINKLYYMDDVIIEHIHPGAGKAQMDAQYERVNSKYSESHRIFADWKTNKLQEEVKKLI